MQMQYIHVFGTPGLKTRSSLIIYYIFFLTTEFCLGQDNVVTVTMATLTFISFLISVCDMEAAAVFP